MDRVPYRRVTAPRNASSHTNRHNHKPEKEQTNITIGETLIVQSIVSGLLLAIVLVICLIDIGPLVSAREGLHRVLDGATTVEEFTEDLRQFSQNWLNVEIQEETQMPEILDTQAIDIPEVLEDNIPLTADETPLNPHTPGPLVSPGLWD